MKETNKNVSENNFKKGQRTSSPMKFGKQVSKAGANEKPRVISE